MLSYDITSIQDPETCFVRVSKGGKRLDFSLFWILLELLDYLHDRLHAAKVVCVKYIACS